MHFSSFPRETDLIRFFPIFSDLFRLNPIFFTFFYHQRSKRTPACVSCLPAETDLIRFIPIYSDFSDFFRFILPLSDLFRFLPLFPFCHCFHSAIVSDRNRFIPIFSDFSDFFRLNLTKFSDKGHQYSDIRKHKKVRNPKTQNESSQSL